ncbi:MAG: AMP-binding protein [Pseudomonadota bacterium]
MKPGGAAQAPGGWDWPNTVPTHVVQRWIDMQAIDALEQSAPPFWLAWQQRALRELAANAAQVSGWWRRWLTVPPGQLTHRTLGQLPVLRREDFRAAIESEGALRMPPWHGPTATKSTSGSSGVPVQFHLSALSGRVVDSHYMADHHRHGRNLRLPTAALLTRFEEHPGAEHRMLPGDPWQGIAPTAARRSMGASMREHAQWLRRLNPAYLNTAPAVLAGIVDACEEGEPPPAGLQQVMTVGETVTPELRERTLRMLGASIRDRYTCEEVGTVALQCPHDESRYHVCVGNNIVEIVDDAGHAVAAGQPGRVLVTGLQHWASPAVRYDLGDIASMAPQCTCGAQVPVLFKLLGRKRFLVRLPSGERIFLKIVAKDFLRIAPVREFRVTQLTAQAMRVELVLERALSPDEHAALLAMLRKQVYADFDYDIRQVDAIAWTPGAKRQDVVSLV